MKVETGLSRPAAASHDSVDSPFGPHIEPGLLLE